MAEDKLLYPSDSQHPYLYNEDNADLSGMLLGWNKVKYKFLAQS